MLSAKNTSKANDHFAFVPKEARGCMSAEELDEALREMNLDPEMEKAVREVCKKGFVNAPQCKEVIPIDEDDEPDTDTLLAQKRYKEVTSNVFYDILDADGLMNAVLRRCHRLERLTALGSPDIITTNEARMARQKIEAVQTVLDVADEALRKLQLKTDHRSAEERLLESIFADGGKK